MTMDDLSKKIDEHAATPATEPLPHDPGTLIDELLRALERGDVRAAERDAAGTWRAVPASTWR